MDEKAEFDLVIEAGRAERHYWADLWRYRDLLYFLAWRDIAVRYKQTAIGAAWALIRPLMAVVVFTVVFGKLAKLPSAGVPYPLLVAAAILPWQFFASALADSGNSLVGNSNLISKIYFPRLIIPASAIVVGLVDFLVSFLVLLGLMAWYGTFPGWRIVFLPYFVLLAFLASLGMGAWLAALNVKYRDFRYVIPFIIQFGMYLSPVGFSSDVVPAQWKALYYLNPMVGVIEGCRWSILGSPADLDLAGLAVSTGLIALLLAAGVAYFRKTEKSFADVI